MTGLKYTTASNLDIDLNGLEVNTAFDSYTVNNSTFFSPVNTSYSWSQPAPMPMVTFQQQQWNTSKRDVISNTGDNLELEYNGSTLAELSIHRNTLGITEGVMDYG